ncbi:MAG: helix-turn-helix transcriptional regulator, partial [Myxococcota bacterium]
MRADRLLRLIRLLSDGRPRTVPVLAEALEVSGRTLARDLEALEVAGVPVETTRGRNGGVSLPRGWSRLGVGLTAAEVVPLAALGILPRDEAVETTLGTALGKIVAGLPAAQRLQAEEARQRLLIDPTPWWSDPPAAPHLDRLREAVWADRRVRVVYGGRAREVDPLALVLKAETWYLVAATAEGNRVFRCDRIEAVEVLDAPAVRPPDFDLVATWRDWCARFEATRPSFPVRLHLTARGRERLAALRPSSERAHIHAAPEPEVDFHRLDIALSQLVQLGADARPLGPPELLEAMCAVARS